ncbi:hypothetical protein KJA15_02840 [Patescibacteria group bacterium]|nr:hypothetical protein [Patescibacteria group bacterium]
MNIPFNLIIENPLFLLIVPSLVILFLAIIRQWRIGIISIFIWLYLEDIIRRLFPGQPPQIMLLKEVLILLTYFAFFATFIIKQKKIWKPPFFAGLFIFGGWCVVEALNPNLPNMWFAAIGFRSYLWYLPILFLGYYMFSEKESLIKFCRILVYTSILLALIAVFQYIFFYDLPSSFVQPLEAAHEIHYFKAGKIKLVPSIFGTAERYARFSLFLFLLGLGLLFYSETSLKQRFLLFTSTILALLGIFVSGRRAPMYLSIIGILFWIFIYYRYQLLKLFKFRLSSSLMVVFLILVIAGSMVYLGFKDISEYFWNSISSIKDRISLAKTEIAFAAEFSGFFGLGLGVRSQGLHYIPGGQEWYEKEIASKRLGIESGLGKVLYELGFIGLLLFIFFYDQLFFSWLRRLKRLRKTALYSLGLSICLFSILMLLWFFKGHQIFGDATTLIFFWFFMGILFRLKNLSKD